MSDLVDAANDLALLLEQAAPRQGLRHISHARVIVPARRKVERVLREYFRRQEAALLGEVKPKIGLLEAASPSSSWRESLEVRAKEASSGGHLYANAILPLSIHPLRFPVTQVETSEYNSAVRSAIVGAAAQAAKEMDTGAAAAEDFASRYLRDFSLTKLVGDFSDASINRLRDAIADAWDAGGSFEQVVAAIRDTFAEFSEKRAEMIAQTEINDAYVYGRMQTARSAGLDQKAWDEDGTEFCEICGENIDAGWIGIDEPFPSGDMAPTAHPRCDCSIDFQKGAAE